MVIEDRGDELVDAPEIAVRLGMKTARQVLDLRIHRLGFPEPIGRQGRRLIWSWSQVEHWADVSTLRAPTPLG